MTIHCQCFMLWKDEMLLGTQSEEDAHLTVILLTVCIHVGVILEPNANVKAPMVRKPVHMIKPRVVTLQKSLHNSLEKRKDLMEMHPKTSLVRNFTDSVPLTGHEGSFGKFCLIYDYLPANSRRETDICVKYTAQGQLIHIASLT